MANYESYRIKLRLRLIRLSHCRKDAFSSPCHPRAPWRGIDQHLMQMLLLSHLYPLPECSHFLSYPDVSFFRHVLSSFSPTFHPILNLPQRILNFSHLPFPSPFSIFRRLQKSFRLPQITAYQGETESDTNWLREKSVRFWRRLQFPLNQCSLCDKQLLPWSMPLLPSLSSFVPAYCPLNCPPMIVWSLGCFVTVEYEETWQCYSTSREIYTQRHGVQFIRNVINPGGRVECQT